MNHTEVKRRQITLFTYILGMGAIILFANKIGDNGIAYLGAALETYLFLLTLTVASLPDVLARLYRSRIAKRQYRNADKMFTGAFLYALFWGIVGSLLFWLAADAWMEKVLLVPYGALTLKLLAPAFLLNCCIFVLQGYFQGMGTAMPTIVGEAAKQVFILSFGSIFAFGLYGYGEKAAALLQNDAFKSLYGSAGIGLGITASLLFVLLFFFFVYMGAGRKARKQNGRDGMRMTEGSSAAVRIIGASVLPVSLLAVMERLPVLLGMMIFQRGSADSYYASFEYGAYYGKYQLLLWIGTALLLLLMIPLQSMTVVSARREEYRQAKEVMTAGFQWVFMTAAFISVLFIVLGQYLIPVLYRNDTSTAGKMLQTGGISLLFMGVGVFASGILLHLDRGKTVVVNLIIMLIVYVGVLLFAMTFTEGSGMSLVYARLAADGVFCVLNAVALCRGLKCSIDMIRAIILPALAALVTGLLLLLLGKALHPSLGNGGVLVVCILVGAMVFPVLLLVSRCLKERTLRLMPGGKILLKFGTILHLL